jgi:G3E family GTPase
MLDLFPSTDIGPFGRRLRSTRGARIPVTVITGFLGAGKTTLVKRFLEQPEGRGTAVVVNEFGAVSIDDAMLRASAEETVLLGNGCLCCAFRSDLQVALRRLVAERDSGRAPGFCRIVIETSGLADPSPILATFTTDRALGGEFHVEAVITVVDAVNGTATLDWSAEARRQVMLADRLVITKEDLATAGDMTRLEQRLRALNPRAEIVAAANGVIDPRLLTCTASHVAPARFAAEAVHSDDIQSFTITKDQPIAWLPFARAMDTLVALRGADLLRVKGLLNVAGCRGPVVVQFVQHLAHPPVELAAWPDAARQSRLVFITRGVPEADIRALLDAVRRLAG